MLLNYFLFMDQKRYKMDLTKSETAYLYYDIVMKYFLLVDLDMLYSEPERYIMKKISS